MDLNARIALLPCPTALRKHCFEAVLTIARSYNVQELIPFIQSAVRFEEGVSALEERRRALGLEGAGSHHGSRAKRVDGRLDKLLRSLDGQLRDDADTFGLGDPVGLAAYELREALFPLGVEAIVRTPFIAEYELVKELLARALEPKLQSQIATTGQATRVAQIRETNAEYGDILGTPTVGVMGGELRFARWRGNTMLRQLLAAIVSLRLGDASPATEALRNNLARPILQREEEYRQQLKEQRPGDDGEDEQLSDGAGAFS